jgi:P27 family predicted phage terminase small subunit
LGLLARKEWDRLVAQLGPLRLLTHLDRAALATYCEAYGLWAESTEAIQKHGVMIKSPQRSAAIALSRGREPPGRNHDAYGEPEPSEGMRKI